MNCQEAQATMLATINKGGPFALTRGERSRLFQHVFACTACMQYIEEQAAKEEKNLNLTQEERAELEAVGGRLYLDDLEDPEFGARP